MEKINYSIVDVFSQGKYTGNPLAVFKNVGNISESEMQQIAKEINYSETTFIIQNEILEEPLDNLILNFKGGQIPVSFNNQEEILWMKQNEPTFGQILDLNKVSNVLNIDREHIEDRFPIQEVS